MKGELPPDGLPTLVKLSPMHFACNSAFQGKIRVDFEAHVTVLSYGHLRDLNTSAHEVAQEEDASSHVMHSG